MKLLFSAFLASVLTKSEASGGAACPFLADQRGGKGDGSFDVAYRLKVQQRQRELNPNPRSGDGGVPAGGYAAVRAEIAKILDVSQSFWPADFISFGTPWYGGLFIRLAWHCAGSYRKSDGRGGCDGGRIRYDPELSWPDNGNLDQALALLQPIKDMFGSDLSWGDLIILAGNTAIEEAGGPILGFCGGRIDDADGSDSLILGPSDVQEAITPCQSIGLQGQCPAPLGSGTVGLIYVNPAGPVGFPGDTIQSGLDIHEIFARMGFTDRETVSLIGGGHAFGKCHGACDMPPCGDGLGENAFTSGFEGPWTATPTVWTNDYFLNMFDLTWLEITGPGGQLQWQPAEAGKQFLMMLTSDLALRDDPDFSPIAQEYYNDISVLETDFAESWYHLTTADMGGSTARCLGSEVPAIQYWQDDLPSYSATVPDYIPIRASIQALVDEDSSNIAAFAKLAFGCASSFRETDYRGGCNGGRIRFSPEKDWPKNAGADSTLTTLETIKTADISYADLIVLAGQTAIEAAGGLAMPFCGARVDAMSGAGSLAYEPAEYPDASDSYVLLQNQCFLMGLTNRECAATFAVPTGDQLSNQYFVDLQNDNGSFSDIEKALLTSNGDYIDIVEDFVANNFEFLTAFSEAWTKLMTADRFDGPRDNFCTGKSHPTLTNCMGKCAQGYASNGPAQACVNACKASGTKGGGCVGECIKAGARGESPGQICKAICNE